MSGGWIGGIDLKYRGRTVQKARGDRRLLMDASILGGEPINPEEAREIALRHKIGLA